LVIAANHGSIDRGPSMIVRHEGKLIVVADPGDAWLKRAGLGVLLLVIAAIALTGSTPIWLTALGALIALISVAALFVPMRRSEGRSPCGETRPIVRA
jgi:hypothetical protein